MSKINLTPNLILRKVYKISKRTDIPGKSRNGHGFQGIFDLGMGTSFVPYKDGYLGACRSGNAGLKDDLEILDFDSNYNIVRRRIVHPGQDPRCFLHNETPYALSWTPRLEVPPYDFSYNITNLVTGHVTELKVQFANDPDRYRDLGKNWMPLTKDNKLYFVVTLEPDINVLQCDEKTGICTWVTPPAQVDNGVKVAPNGISANRGGSPWIYDKYYDCYVGLGHRTYSSHYHTAYMYILSKDFKKIEIGPDLTTLWHSGYDPTGKDVWSKIGSPDYLKFGNPAEKGLEGISDPMSIFVQNGRLFTCIWHFPRTSSRSEEGRGTLYEIVDSSGRPLGESPPIRIKEDNRNIAGVRIDPNQCMVGDLYKPWYFYENPETGCPKDLDQVCLIYKKENRLLNPKDILSTSFLKNPMSTHRPEYLNQNLVKSIREQGQQNPIICTEHFIEDSPPNIDFLEKDPDFEKIRCFEGHHRLVACDEMNIPIRAEVYKMYHMDTPINWSKHYNSYFEADQDLWPYSTCGMRPPIFSEGCFERNDTKYEADRRVCLQQCYDFIKSLDIEINSGVDIGCAEGAMTFMASEELDCHMTGIDLEAGRIIRAQLMRQKYQKENVEYFVSDCSKANYKKYDFAMVLCVLEFVEQHAHSLIEKLSQNTKVVMAELMTNIPQEQEYYENVFSSVDMKVQKLGTWSARGRSYYVLWKQEGE